MVLNRQCAVEAGKEFPNLVVGEEGHVNSLSDTVTVRKDLGVRGSSPLVPVA